MGLPAIIELMIPLIRRAGDQGDRVAIVSGGRGFSYRELLERSAHVATKLLNGAADLWEQRVAFLVSPGFEYVALQWGIWRAGGVAVPLAVSHPAPELEYDIVDSEANIVVAGTEFESRLRPIAEKLKRRFERTSSILRSESAGTGALRSTTLDNMPEIDPNRGAMMLYTSGTTSKPKGVLTTHANIQAQVESLITAWEWSADDVILHVLPLHHLHGILNALTCPLWAGATCEILPQFEAESVWQRFMQGGITVFMAVPTIYMKLIAAWDGASDSQRDAMSAAGRQMRLMVSGSAALTVSTLERWQQISGHVLLERYGMTETGMILSNPLHGERRPGYVGVPLPGIKVRLVDEQGVDVKAGTSGEIRVRGPGVFRAYWNKPEASAKAFRDGWFCTGDIAVVNDGMYRMLGRSSTDIIKTGGYKVSALEIEEVLRTHPRIKECVVVALPDETWGERVCAAVILREGMELTLDELRLWAKERLATYKVPTQLTVLTEFPRNAMGKVVKPEIVKNLK